MKPLRQAIQDYLALRRSLGFKLRDAGRWLSKFADFLEARGATRVDSHPAPRPLAGSPATNQERAGSNGQPMNKPAIGNRSSISRTRGPAAQSAGPRCFSILIVIVIPIVIDFFCSASTRLGTRTIRITIRITITIMSS